MITDVEIVSQKAKEIKRNILVYNIVTVSMPAAPQLFFFKGKIDCYYQQHLANHKALRVCSIYIFLLVFSDLFKKKFK